MRLPRLRISLRVLLVLLLIGPLGAAWLYRWLERRRAERSQRVATSWDITSGDNVLWSAPIGSQTYSTPAISGGKVFVGTNNDHGYVARYPASHDLGVLLCLRASDGKFLWQHSNEKLATGRVQDWPLQGVCGSPVVERNRLWYTSNRAEVVCLDTEGFHDGVNDGPYRNERHSTRNDADVIWKLDLIGQLGVSPHNMSCSDCVVVGPRLFVVAPNGVGEGHVSLPSPDAPAFLCLDKKTGRVLWTDSSSSPYILHGQWGSPAYAVLGGTPQVIFPGGDGWLYSFDPDGDGRGGARLLWKFDCNPKTSRWETGGRGDRNNLIRAPTIHQGRVYIATGQDPEHGEGDAHLWCIDPTRRGDVSPEDVLRRDENGQVMPVPRRRGQACDPDQGEFTRPNPNSALIWRYSGDDLNGNGQLEFEESFHRSLSKPVIKGDLLVITDLSGLVHCLDVETGKSHWVHDMLAATWSTPTIAGDHIYVGNEDGVVALYRLSPDPQQALLLGQPVAMMDMGWSLYSTPVAHNNVLYITTRSAIHAIHEPPDP